MIVVSCQKRRSSLVFQVLKRCHGDVVVDLDRGSVGIVDAAKGLVTVRVPLIL